MKFTLDNASAVTVWHWLSENYNQKIQNKLWTNSPWYSATYMYNFTHCERKSSLIQYTEHKYNITLLLCWACSIVSQLNTKSIWLLHINSIKEPKYISYFEVGKSPQNGPNFRFSTTLSMTIIDIKLSTQVQYYPFYTVCHVNLI